MEISRNQYYLAGLVLLLLGIQFRVIDRIQFTAEFTQFLAERTGHPLAAVSATTQALASSDGKAVKRTICPPEYVGWSLLSLGVVLVLHSWAMQKPGG